MTRFTAISYLAAHSSPLSYRLQIFSSHAIADEREISRDEPRSKPSNRHVVVDVSGKRRPTADTGNSECPMNLLLPTALRTEDFGLRGLKEERDLRHAFGFITWTAAALLASLIGTAAADDGVAPNSGSPVSGKPATAGVPTKEAARQELLKKHRYVAARIDSAREDLERGRVDLAQAKAAAVRKVQSAYHFLDDRATRVLVQIDKMRHPKGVPAAPGTGEPLVVRGQSPGPEAPADFPEFADNNKQLTPTSGPAPRRRSSPKDQAKKLLAQARSAFNAGDYDEARTKALKADQLDVKWDILEDQPQTLIGEIERATGTKILSRKAVKKRSDSATADPRPGHRAGPAGTSRSSGQPV